MTLVRAWVLVQDWLLDRWLFRYRRGAIVGYGPTRTRCTILWQRYQTREVLGPLVSYYVETAEGRTFWASEVDLVELREEGEG
jgi:hypothetical protein